MIELRITIDDALYLLLERMNIELKMRKRAGLIAKNKRLEDLYFRELINIVESSIYDTVLMLPVDLVTKETNLSIIITETVKSLSKIFGHEQFLLYSIRRTRRVIKPAVDFLHRSLMDEKFRAN